MNILPNNIQHFCTPEQAKRLKNFGVIQESLFYHRPTNAPGMNGWETVYVNELNNSRMIGGKELCVSAFMFSEISHCLTWDCVAISPPYKKDKEWRLFIADSEKDQHDLNEVVAVTDTLIYMLENRMISVAHINNKLRPTTIRKAV